MEVIAIEVKTKFTINKKVAQKYIKILGSVINHNAVLPILECVRVVISKSGVTMIATDLQNVVKVEMPTVSYSGEISTCVYQSQLQWFFNKAISDDVSIEYKKGQCIMRSGDVEIPVACEKDENYPKLPPQLEPTFKINVAGKEIIHIIKNTLPFISNDDLRPAMAGVNLSNHNSELTVAATDAHRLYFKSLSNYDGVVNAILPRMFVSALANYFSRLDFELMLDGYFVSAKSDNIEVISRLIDARYPDWRMVLPQTSYEFYFNRSEMLKKLSLLKYFSNHSTWLVKLSVNQDGIRLDVGDADFSTSGYSVVKLDSFNGLSKNETIIFGLNTQFFIDCLAIETKEELVHMKHNGTTTGAIIIDDCTILMPLLTNEI